MKRTLPALLALLLLLSGCTPPPSATPAATPSPSPTGAANAPITLTDSTGQTVALAAPPKTVVGLSSSMAEIWLLAGGVLAGTTDDAVNERGLDVGDAAIVGTIKKPSVEAILALEPDLVITSADIEGHVEAAALLTEGGIPCYAAKVEQFSDYLKVLEDFTALTDRKDLYEQNGIAVQGQIDGLRVRVPAGETPPSALYLRAYSSGVKVKARDNVACDILADVGVVNVADGNSALEELSMEAIVSADPDFIFVVTMGDEQAAIDELDRTLRSNPAWDGLSAVQAGHFYILPKELFHYKPNAKWGEAYEYLLHILWPETYPES